MDIAARFAQTMRNFSYKQPCIVGVSGGGDSMALVLLLHQFLHQTLGPNTLLTAVTVDHQQRPESEEEAQTVHRWLTQRGIQHEILVWEHGPLTSRVEEQGRLARYRLMSEFCKKHGYHVIYTAHHARDQIETFLMRLKRGAGLSGLAAIRPVTLLGKDQEQIQLIRPLLSFFPEDLLSFLKSQNQSFVHDPCNDNESYERCQLRKGRHKLESLGLTESALLKSIQHLQEIEAQLEKTADLFWKQNAETPSSLSMQAFQPLLPQVAKKVLQKMISQTSSKDGICSQRLLDQVYQKIQAPFFRCTTAHGCWIRKRGGRLVCEPEQRRGTVSQRVPLPGKS